MFLETSLYKGTAETQGISPPTLQDCLAAALFLSFNVFLIGYEFSSYLERSFFAYLMGFTAPHKLMEVYGSEKVTIYVEQNLGKLMWLAVETEVPGERPDFLVSSDHAVAQKTLQGELARITTFIRRRIKREP